MSSVSLGLLTIKSALECYEQNTIYFIFYVLLCFISFCCLALVSVAVLRVSAGLSRFLFRRVCSHQFELLEIKLRMCILVQKSSYKRFSVLFFKNRHFIFSFLSMFVFLRSLSPYNNLYLPVHL